MPTLRDALTNALDIPLRIAHANVYEANVVSGGPSHSHGFQITASGERRLDPETFTIPEELARASDDFSARRDRRTTRILLINPLRNGIRIKKIFPSLEIETAGERAFSRAVGSGQNRENGHDGYAALRPSSRRTS